ncbi:MAG: hypothetical protein C0448_08185 [Sphingobacteriaceae bacterium]|nr:hypothetical protein [Sphingobacteriaceae bacterium]
MSIDNKLKSLRIAVRQNTKTVMSHVIRNNISRLNLKNKTPDICMFCGSTTSLTKEHVVPRWTYENNTKNFFTTSVNGHAQTYNKTTIPACSICNNDKLGYLELYLNQLFSQSDVKVKPFSKYDLSNIIRWLEIIDYKFQILNARKLFIAPKGKEFIPYLSDFSLSVLRPEIDFSPFKAISQIRKSQKRITIKNKEQNINSLIVFKTTNKSFNFFHTMDEYIFIELPQYKLALFYFYKQTFSSDSQAHKKAIEILKKHYN